MLFTDEYIAEVRSRLDSGDIDQIEGDLLDALNCIEELRAQVEWLDVSNHGIFC